MAVAMAVAMAVHEGSYGESPSSSGRIRSRGVDPVHGDCDGLVRYSDRSRPLNDPDQSSAF